MAVAGANAVMVATPSYFKSSMTVSREALHYMAFSLFILRGFAYSSF
jgi:hypothetical protein